MYLWVEKIKEFMENRSDAKENKETEEEVEDEPRLPSMECPPILTGDCFEDRKSVFQVHF